MKHLLTKSLCLSLLVISFNSFAAKDLKKSWSYVQAAVEGKGKEWTKDSELAKLIDRNVSDKVKLVVDKEAGVEITVAVIKQLTHGYRDLDVSSTNVKAAAEDAGKTLLRELIIRYGTKALAKVGLSTESIENKIKEMSPATYQYLALIAKYSLKMGVDVAVDKVCSAACNSCGSSTSQDYTPPTSGE